MRIAAAISVQVRTSTSSQTQRMFGTPASSVSGATFVPGTSLRRARMSM